MKNTILRDDEEGWTLVLAIEEIDRLRMGLRNFVEAVGSYDETGVWPDSLTIRRLAEEGRSILSPNVPHHLPGTAAAQNGGTNVTPASHPKCQPVGVRWMRLFAFILSWLEGPIIAGIMLIILYFTANLWLRYRVGVDVNIIDVLSQILQNASKK